MTATALVTVGLAWTAWATPPPPRAAPHEVEWRIVVDDLHLDFIETGRLRAFLLAVIDEALAHGEHVSVRTTGPSGVVVPSSSDETRLRAAIKAITGNGIKEADAAVAQSSDRDGRHSEITQRAMASLTVLRQCLDEPAAGSTVVVFISNGLPLPPDTATGALAEATAPARQRAMPLLAADAREPARLVPPPPPELGPAIADLRAEQAASLRTLSSASGGATARGLADTLAAMAALRR